MNLEDIEREREERIDEMAEAFKRALTSLVFRQVRHSWETLFGEPYWGFRPPDEEEKS